MRLAVFWVSVELYIQRSGVDGGITGSDRPSLDSVDEHYLELSGMKEGIHQKGIEVCVCMWCLEIVAFMKIMRGAAALT